MKKIAVIFLLMFGCDVQYELIDAQVEIDAGRNQFSFCDETMTHWDFSNCGACGNECDASKADSCFDSECRCGFFPACGPDADCRYGMCVIPDIERGEVCEFDEECDINSACIQGFCTFIQCLPEVCDGLDNDCDGVIDGTISGPLSKWCYSGPETDPTMINPPCRAGAAVCINGEWTGCQGEVPPIPEIGTLACDGHDNDCDLCIDSMLIDGECSQIVVGGFDVVFIMDTSASMIPYNEAVRDAMVNFATTFNRPDFRYALVYIPGNTLVDPELRLDFSSYSRFISELSVITDSTSSSEPSYDAIYQIGTNEFGLSFNDGYIRIIIMFTDEYGQSYRPDRISELRMCESLINGEQLFVFTENEHFGDFDRCSRNQLLSDNSSEMAATLESLIEDPCL